MNLRGQNTLRRCKKTVMPVKRSDMIWCNTIFYNINLALVSFKAKYHLNRRIVTGFSVHGFCCVETSTFSTRKNASQDTIWWIWVVDHNRTWQLFCYHLFLWMITIYCSPTVSFVIWLYSCLLESFAAFTFHQHCEGNLHSLFHRLHSNHVHWIIVAFLYKNSFRFCSHCHH